MGIEQSLNTKWLTVERMLSSNRSKAQIMGMQIWTYVIYGLSAVGLTGTLARSLHRNGTLFLESVFDSCSSASASSTSST